MEGFISKNLLDQNRIISEEKLFFSFQKTLDNIFSKEGKLEKGVFLSHKHTDKELVYKLIKLFKKHNIDVYIDWLDDDMPIVTNQETALKIKEKIKNSKKFLLLATDEAINSKWCNWELGLGDAEKYIENIAIIPVTNSNNGTWLGNEYLQIYPALTIDKDKNELFIEFQGEKQSFFSWLNN